MQSKTINNPFKQQNQMSMHRRMQLLHIQNTDMTSVINDESFANLTSKMMDTQQLHLKQFNLHHAQSLKTNSYQS